MTCENGRLGLTSVRKKKLLRKNRSLSGGVETRWLLGSWLAGHCHWDLVWVGACYWHGVGGFVFNSSSSRRGWVFIVQFFFFLCIEASRGSTAAHRGHIQQQSPIQHGGTRGGRSRARDPTRPSALGFPPAPHMPRGAASSEPRGSASVQLEGQLSSRSANPPRAAAVLLRPHTAHLDACVSGAPSAPAHAPRQLQRPRPLRPRNSTLSLHSSERLGLLVRDRARQRRPRREKRSQNARASSSRDSGRPCRRRPGGRRCCVRAVCDSVTSSPVCSQPRESSVISRTGSSPGPG